MSRFASTCFQECKPAFSPVSLPRKAKILAHSASAVVAYDEHLPCATDSTLPACRDMCRVSSIKNCCCETNTLAAEKGSRNEVGKDLSGLLHPYALGD